MTTSPPARPPEAAVGVRDSVPLEEPGADRQLRRVALACAAMSAGLAALAILGWVTHATTLSSFGPAFIPMAPSTAVCFLLLAGAPAAYAAVPQRAFAPRAAAAAAWVVSALALVQLAQALGGGPSTADTLLVPRPARFGQVLVGRMSPLTAIAFLLAGGALLAVAGGRRRPALGDLGGWLASLLAVLGVVVLLGYGYGTPLLYGGPGVPMALTTALAFGALSLALLCLA